MKILVTGALGQLGTWIRQLTAGNNHYIFTDITPAENVLKLDITNGTEVESFVRNNNIGLIVNCAAYTNVEKAEDDVETCFRINRDGPANLAQAMASVGGTLIHISTDYVFSGKINSRPLLEEDCAEPLGIYGKSKLAAEEVIRDSGCKYLIFRTAWLYSEFGRNFVKTMMSLMKEGKAIKVVNDQWGSPTYARDLAEAIVQIISSGKSSVDSGIWHFTDEGTITWFDFAKEISAIGEYASCSITPCSTKEYPTKAARPAYSVLDKSKFKRTFDSEIPQWRESLKKCMDNIREWKI